MKRMFLTICFISLSLELSAQSVRVMSMNIKEGGKPALHRVAPYAEVINEYKPDFVCLQEVDHRTLRNGGKDFLGELAEKTGMFPYFCQSIVYQGGGFGVAILSRYPFYKAQKQIAKIDGAREDRATGWVYVMLPNGKKIRVASTHLALESESITSKNIALLNASIFEDKETPTLLIGDFNCTPDSGPLEYAKIKWQEIGAGSGFTIPSDKPTRQLDYVMGYPKNKWRSKSYNIIAKPNLSDHCFIVADVEYEE